MGAVFVAWNQQSKAYILKYLLIFWGIPVGLLACWYGLSFNDINFGYVLLSREFNDVVFKIYGQILGVDPSFIRGALVNVLLVDTVIIFALFYFKPIKRLRALWASHQPLKQLARMWTDYRDGRRRLTSSDPYDPKTVDGIETGSLAQGDVDDLGLKELAARLHQPPLLNKNSLSKAP